MSQQHPAGWYPQPDGSQRYWDGMQWTNQVAPGAPVTPQAGPPGTPAPAAERPAKPWFLRKRVLIPAVAVVAIVGLATTQGGGGTPAAAPTPAPSAPSTSPDASPTSESSTTPTEASEDDAAAPSAEPTEVVATLGNGDHIVGVDIEPGVYRAEVEAGIIELCTVAQTREDGDVMDVRNANEGSVIFTVKNKKNTIVSFSGCGMIAPAKDVLRKDPEEITNGYWLVRSELEPGKYQGLVDTDSAIQLGTIYQMDADGDVMDLRNANEGKVVFTVKDKKGSVVSFSGFSEIKRVG